LENIQEKLITTPRASNSLINQQLLFKELAHQFV